MTITSQNPDLKTLQDVIPGIARFDSYTVTFGTYAEGSDASLLLADGDRTRPTVVVGATGSGKTALIESLMAGAHAAGIPADLADMQRQTAVQVIGDYHTLVLDRSRDIAGRGLLSGVGVLPLRLLLVDDLTALDSDTADLLAQVAKLAPKTGVAVIVASQDFTAMIPGGALLRETLSTGNLIELRTVYNDIPRTFEDGSTTAGAGTVNGGLFRAWRPST